jgi:YidC/Oxa1 family membrane protein insertase
MVIQLPILILIWRAILYSAEQIHFSPGFLWLPDLSLRDPLFILVIATTLIMIVQTRLMTPMTTGETSGSQKYMGYFFPVLMAVLLWSFPAGLWLYYFLTTAFQVGQQALVNWEMARADGGSTVVSAEPEEDEEGGDEDDGEHQA